MQMRGNNIANKAFQDGQDNPNHLQLRDINRQRKSDFEYNTMHRNSLYNTKVERLR